ncbi:MAG: hypothetical protein RIR97_758 [Pseudomonadota bacterium]
MPTDTARQTLHARILVLAGAVSGMGGAPAMIALLVATALWSVRDLVTRRLPMHLAQPDRLLVIMASLFVAVYLLFAALNSSGFQGDLADLAVSISPLALYLLVFPVILRLRTPQCDSLDRLVLGAGICAILPLPLALYQVFVQGDRATGVTGNALPFALICAVFSVLSLFNVLSESRWRPYLGLAGFFSGLTCLFLSGSIGLLPVVIPASLIFVIVYRQAFLRWYNRISLALAAIGLLAMGLAASQWSERLVNMVLFMLRPDGSKRFTTFNLRLQMWDAAVVLIRERPWLGHGMQNRVQLLHDRTGLDFVQFHNGFLNAWVDSGLAGVLATVLLLLTPLIMAIRAPRDAAYGRRLFIASYVTAIFLVGGLTYVLFLDPVYDSVFLWLAIAIALSVPAVKTSTAPYQSQTGT